MALHIYVGIVVCLGREAKMLILCVFFPGKIEIVIVQICEICTLALSIRLLLEIPKKLRKWENEQAWPAWPTYTIRFYIVLLCIV